MPDAPMYILDGGVAKPMYYLIGGVAQPVYECCCTEPPRCYSMACPDCSNFCVSSDSSIELTLNLSIKDTPDPPYYNNFSAAEEAAFLAKYGGGIQYTLPYYAGVGGYGYGEHLSHAGGGDADYGVVMGCATLLGQLLLGGNDITAVIANAAVAGTCCERTWTLNADTANYAFLYSNLNAATIQGTIDGKVIDNHCCRDTLGGCQLGDSCIDANDNDCPEEPI